jgi:hypothetical protein
MGVLIPAVSAKPPRQPGPRRSCQPIGIRDEACAVAHGSPYGRINMRHPTAHKCPQLPLTGSTRRAAFGETVARSAGGPARHLVPGEELMQGAAGRRLP